MKRNAIYTLIACLFLAACSSEEEWMISDDQTPAIELGEDQIAVQLNLQTTDFTVEETRSANPIELKSRIRCTTYGYCTIMKKGD